MTLVFQNGQPGRRTGLSRNIGSSLLRTFNASGSQRQAAMPPRALTRGRTAGVTAEAVAKTEVVEEEEDILRPPESDNESDEEFERKNNQDIQKVDFRSASEQPEEQKEIDNVNAGGRKKGSAIASGKATTRLRRGNLSPGSSQPNASTKRKGQKELKQFGTGMIDAHGRPKVNKKPRTSTYGSKKASKKPLKVESETEEDSPKKPFNRGPTIESPEKPEAEEGNVFKPPNWSSNDSPATTPGSGSKFRNPIFTQTPDKEESLPRPVFKNPGIGLDDSLEESNLDESQPTLPEKLQKTIVEANFAATQKAGFKSTNFEGDELVGIAQSLLAADGSRRPMKPATLPNDDGEEEEFPTMTQIAKCPMCGKSVDPDELRAFGRMNTRKQEKFCRSHRKTTALNTWKEEEYPTIDWAKLDSRISKHHSFIKDLINGADSYYRERLSETVNAGKNRSLLKSNYNPTPGYYGTRGLCAISENTMRKFTPLLKRRMVVDRLMAARGFTPYVEYVVVPEVAVKLIMEDMKCGAERAREIMSESLEVGELLSEEVRDIVTREGSEEIKDSE